MRTLTSRLAGAAVEGALISLLILALIAVPALAARGGGGGGKPGGGDSTGGTIALAMVSDANADGLPNFGDRVTFTVATAATNYPYVTLLCSQGGTVVYRASKGIFPTSLGQVFTLGPTGSWQSGDANCTATLEDWDSYSKNGKIATLTSMSFAVSG